MSSWQGVRCADSLNHARPGNSQAMHLDSLFERILLGGDSSRDSGVIFSRKSGRKRETDGIGGVSGARLDRAKTLRFRDKAVLECREYWSWGGDG